MLLDVCNSLNQITMKATISFILFLSFSLSINAQYSSSKKEIDRELLTYLETDPYLYIDYKDAQNGLKSAKTLGIITIGLMGVDLMLLSAASNSDPIFNGPTYVGMFLISTLTTCVTGTIALIKHSKAKSKIRNIEYIAKYKMKESSSLDLKISTNGLGLVYSF